MSLRGRLAQSRQARDSIHHSIYGFFLTVYGCSLSACEAPSHDAGFLLGSRKTLLETKDGGRTC